jgi:hypothetical protein
MLSVSCLSFLALVANAAPSVKASIVRRAAGASGETTLAVVLQPTDIVLGAYQGRLRFDPASLSIVSVTTPNSSDATRVMNAADTAKGVVQFAAFTISGFKTQDVLILVVRPKRDLQTARFAVDVDVANDLQGKAIPASQLVPARGLSGEPAGNR